MQARLLSILAVALLVGCVSETPARLGVVSPKPNVLLPTSTQTISLRLDDAVNDAFRAGPGAVSVTITDWRTTLENGFHNGVARFFAAPPESGSTDVVLVVRAATLEFVDVGMGHSRGFHRIAAQVRFQAALIDTQQQVLKTWGDTAVARKTVEVWFNNGPPRDDMSSTTASAVEAMFEEIANGMPAPV